MGTAVGKVPMKAAPAIFGSFHRWKEQFSSPRPAGRNPRGEAKLRRKFFAKLSFKKAGGGVPEAKRSFAERSFAYFSYKKSRRSRPVIGTRAPKNTLRGATQFQNRATLFPLAPVLRQRGPRPSPGPLVALSSSGPFPRNPFSRGVSLCWAVTGLLMRRRGGFW